MPQQTDDLMPNDGSFMGGVPPEPPEQDIERKKEKARTLEVLPVLKNIVEYFEDRISFYGSVDAIPLEDKKDPIRFMNMHNANELVRENLRQEKEYIEGLIDTHAKNK